METKPSGILDDGSDRVVVDQGAQTPDPVVTDVTEPVVPSDADMVDTYLEDGGEITYDESQQENFKVDLLTAGESGQALFRQIESTEFINADGSFSEATIAAAKKHNMTDQEIQGHQNAIYKQLETQRNKMFDDAKLPRGYGAVVMDWMMTNFSKAELAVFEADCEKDLTGSIQSVERYYQHVTSGGAR